MIKHRTWDKTALFFLLAVAMTFTTISLLPDAFSVIKVFAEGGEESIDNPELDKETTPNASIDYDYVGETNDVDSNNETITENSTSSSVRSTARSPADLGSYVARVESDNYMGEILYNGSIITSYEEKFIHDWKVAIDLNTHQANNNTLSSAPQMSALEIMLTINGGTWARYNEPRDLLWLDWPTANDSRCITHASYGIKTTGAILKKNGFERGVGNFTYTFQALNSTNGRLSIYDSTVDLSATNADRWYALIEGIYITPTGGEVPTVQLISAQNRTEQLNTSNVSVPRARNITVSVVNPTASQNFIYFDELYIAESTRGDFTYGKNDFNPATGVYNVYPIVTLWAPNDYRWAQPASHQAIGPHYKEYGYDGPYGYNTRHGIKNVELSDTAHYINHADFNKSNSFNNRFLSIHLPLSKHVTSGAPAERIALRGIRMSANSTADIKDVTVHYLIDWVNSSGIIVASYDNLRVNKAWTLPADPSLDGRRVSPSDWKSFKAGTRAWNEIKYGLRPGESASTIRSGNQGLDGEYYTGFLDSTMDQPSNNLGNVDDWEEIANNHWTGWVRLQESAIGVWGAGPGMDLTFSVPSHDGAIIMGAEIIFPEGFYDDYPSQSSSSDRQAARYATGHDNKGGWYFPDAYGVLTTPSYVRITPPLRYERISLRQIDIRFLLSVEPGYEHKYGKDIIITVTGPSVEDLKGNNTNTVVAAFAKDPITFSIENIEHSITNNNTYNLAVLEIEDIVIRETDYGTLRKGDEIWVYITGVRPNEVEFSTNVTANVNTQNSGLVLTRGSVLRHRWPNAWVNGMRFTVEERSHFRTRRANSEVGEIVITGGKMTGPVYPDVAYYVVVSGSAVAANQYSVFGNRRGTITGEHYDKAHAYSWRLFDSEPYSAAVFESDG